jgi:hypothetical protein
MKLDMKVVPLKIASGLFFEFHMTWEPKEVASETCDDRCLKSDSSNDGVYNVYIFITEGVENIEIYREFS